MEARADGKRNERRQKKERDQEKRTLTVKRKGSRDTDVDRKEKGIREREGAWKRDKDQEKQG